MDGMSEDIKTTESTTTETVSGLGESSFRFFGSDVSLRGVLAFILVLALCVVTVMDPESYADTFKITVTTIVAFYFGQQSKK